MGLVITNNEFDGDDTTLLKRELKVRQGIRRIIKSNKPDEQKVKEIMDTYFRKETPDF